MKKSDRVFSGSSGAMSLLHHSRAVLSGTFSNTVHFTHAALITYEFLCMICVLRCQMTNLFIFLFELVPSLQQQQWLTHVRHNKSQQTPWQTWQRSQTAPRKKLCRLANGGLSKRMPACPNWITVSSMGLGVRVSKRLKGWQQAKLKH